MREFLIQALRDLESLTGLRQLYFLESDQDTGAQKIKVCIDGMMLACQDYPYIPEEAKKKIIREQMVKDQNYDALNSRVIHKWLSMFKDKYWTKGESLSEPEAVADVPEERVQEYLRQIRDNLDKIGKPEYKNGFAEIRKKAGMEASISATKPRPEFVVGDGKYLVHADNQEEADKAYEAFEESNRPRKRRKS